MITSTTVSSLNSLDEAVQYLKDNSIVFDRFDNPTEIYCTFWVRESLVAIWKDIEKELEIFNPPRSAYSRRY